MHRGGLASYRAMSPRAVRTAVSQLEAARVFLHFLFIFLFILLLRGASSKHTGTMLGVCMYVPIPKAIRTAQQSTNFIGELLKTRLRFNAADCDIVISTFCYLNCRGMAVAITGDCNDHCERSMELYTALISAALSQLQSTLFNEVIGVIINQMFTAHNSFVANPIQQAF